MLFLSRIFLSNTIKAIENHYLVPQVVILMDRQSCKSRWLRGTPIQGCVRWTESQGQQGAEGSILSIKHATKAQVFPSQHDHQL